MIPEEAVDNSGMTITEFLEARIAEDEAEAQQAITERSKATPNMGGDTSLESWPDSPVPAVLVGPERVLAECAAKRAIIEAHGAVRDEGWMSGKDHDYLFCGACGTLDDAPVAYPCATLMILAAVYADHEDYRQEWAL